MRKFVTFCVLSAYIIFFVAHFVFYFVSQFMINTTLFNVPVFKESVEEGLNLKQDSFSENLYEQEMMVNNITGHEAVLIGFINKNLMKENGGVITNTINSKGRDTLSESVGILMEYSIHRGDEELFKKEFLYLKENFLSNDNLVKWEDSDSEATCNAVIDDFRIIRSLFEAYNKWGNTEYLETAQAIQKGIYEKQVKNGLVYEFYDWKSGMAKKSVPLCYIDLYAINKCRFFNEDWNNAFHTQFGIVKNGRIGNSPFFYKYFNYTTAEYSLDEEYEKDKGICMIYTLYTVLHMAEANEDTQFFTDWLKSEMQKGKLYGWYNPYSLKPINNMESTSVYALSAIYAKKVGEDELYDNLMKKMLKFMVDDNKSPYYGGFGDGKSGVFYSFDNLTALLAFAMGNNTKSYQKPTQEDFEVYQ